MSLNVNNLENRFLDLFDVNKLPNPQDRSETASSIINSVIDYLQDSEVLLANPGVQPGTPPIIDPTFPVAGIKLSCDVLEVGRPVLRAALFTDLLAGTIGWQTFSAAFTAYMLTLNVWRGLLYVPSAPLITIPAAPPNILLAHLGAFNQNNSQIAANILATQIHRFVTNTTVSGILIGNSTFLSTLQPTRIS